MFIVSYLIDFVIIFCMFCVVFLWLYHVSCTIYHNVCVFFCCVYSTREERLVPTGFEFKLCIKSNRQSLTLTNKETIHFEYFNCTVICVR